jgi:hypothetical protein
VSTRQKGNSTFSHAFGMFHRGPESFIMNCLRLISALGHMQTTEELCGVVVRGHCYIPEIQAEIILYIRNSEPEL